MIDLFGLDGRTVVVTGGAAGIGKGIAEVMATVGARVAVLDLDADAAEAAGASVGGIGVVADICDGAALAAAVAAVVDRLGPLALWVNNAGGLAGHRATPSLEVERSAVEDIVGLNLVGTLSACQAAARSMIAHGEGGAIVNICSLQGERSAPQLAAYGAAKAGVASLTRSLALEWAPHGIRVNGVAPSIVDTPAVAAQVTAERRAATLAAMPLAMIADPHDIATVVLALGSNLSRYVTGQVLLADGGMSLTTARAHRS